MQTARTADIERMAEDVLCNSWLRARTFTQTLDAVISEKIMRADTGRPCNAGCGEQVRRGKPYVLYNVIQDHGKNLRNNVTSAEYQFHPGCFRKLLLERYSRLFARKQNCDEKPYTER